MKITILLHSATGNTRLVTRYAASRLAALGHSCVVHDIVKHADPPALGDVDLLGVACPTMYFRPTFAMEQYLARLPDALAARPAFLLATAGGEPGAHFEILGELLAGKGYRALGAHWMISPDSWPLHHRAVRPLAALTPAIQTLARLGPRVLRAWWAIAWPAVGDPDVGDREQLEAFLERMLAAAQAGNAAQRAPTAQGLHGAVLYLDHLGRFITRDKIAPYASPRFDAARCDGCGTCVAVCPAHIIVQATAKGVPAVGDGCTGCFACYNRCPTGAVSAFGAPGGKAQYAGPSRGMRDVLRAPASSDAG